jgi:hypothetical protein
VFGLLNSTPHSLRVGRTVMSELLLEMALSSFAVVGAASTRPRAG